VGPRSTTGAGSQPLHPIYLPEQTGDVAAYAKAHAAFVRAFAEPLLRLNWAPWRTSTPSSRGTFDEMARLVASDPPHYKYRYIDTAVLLRRC